MKVYCLFYRKIETGEALMQLFSTKEARKDFLSQLKQLGFYYDFEKCSRIVID